MGAEDAAERGPHPKTQLGDLTAGEYYKHYMEAELLRDRCMALEAVEETQHPEDSEGADHIR